jgi:glutamyl-tRNA synthetase
MSIEELHVAIVNDIISKQKGEHLIVRIDDGNKAENIIGKDTEIMEILEKFALRHDKVFHQSEKRHLHQTLAIRLLEEGKAFVCTCHQKEEEPYTGTCFNVDPTMLATLKEKQIPFVIRVKKPTETIIYDDLIQGKVTATADEIDSFIILNIDNTPTDDFASACDDILSGVNFIIEKEDKNFHAPKQKYIQTLLGYETETTYAHLPHLQHHDQDITVQSLFEEGFIPDAIINYLLLAGNTNPPKQIFTLPEAIEWFRLETIEKQTFDLKQLRAINREHLKRIDDKTLSSLFGFADGDIGKLAKLYLESHASTVKELESKIKAIFSPKNFENEWKEKMRMLEEIILSAPMIDQFDAFQTYLEEKSGFTKEELSKPLRLLLTGTQDGPDLSSIYPLIKPYLLEIAS